VPAYPGCPGKSPLNRCSGGGDGGGGSGGSGCKTKKSFFSNKLS